VIPNFTQIISTYPFSPNLGAVGTGSSTGGTAGTKGEVSFWVSGWLSVVELSAGSYGGGGGKSMASGGISIGP
jgi:hypothetical protein